MSLGNLTLLVPLQFKTRNRVDILNGQPGSQEERSKVCKVKGL